MAERRCIVVGGGVIGVCIAYELSRRGAWVTLLERDRVGGAASFGNAGSIAPGHGPLNRPGLSWQALRSFFDRTSPVYFPFRPDPSLVGWLWSFRRHCTERHVAHCMRLLGPLGHLSQSLFDEIVAREELSCDYRRRGYYEVYLTQRGLEGGRLEAEKSRIHGYAPLELSGDRMREREPALSAAVTGAIWHEEAATCNPYDFVSELAGRAQRYGTDVRTGITVDRVVVDGSQVTGVRTGDGATIEADTVVLATGAYSPRLLRELGVHLPLQPAKGYHRDASAGDGGAPALVEACILAETYIFCNPIDDFVRLAGTLEFSGLNHEISRARMEQLTRGARDYFRQVGSGGTRSEWCGLRPCLPDGLPAVGWAPGIEGLFVANGHAMMGLTLGPVTGRLAAEAILDEANSLDTGAMDTGRFRRGRSKARRWT